MPKTVKLKMQLDTTIIECMARALYQCVLGPRTRIDRISINLCPAATD